MRIKFPAALLCGLILALSFSCATPPAFARGNDDAEHATSRPAEWATPIDTERNLYRMTPTLYRSAQPEQTDAVWIKRLGIRTIINLRARHQDKDVLNLPDVTLVDVPMNTWDVDDDKIVAALRAIDAAQKNGPVLIHCLHGSDRTGTVAAMYRIVEQGWTREQALRELKEGNYGFHRMWFNLPRYIKRANIEDLRARLTQK